MARETLQDKKTKLSKHFYSSNPEKLSQDLASLAGVTGFTGVNLDEVRLKVAKAKMTEMLKGASAEDKNDLGKPTSLTINEMSLKELQILEKKMKILQGRRQVLNHSLEKVAKEEGKIEFDDHVNDSNFGDVFASISDYGIQQVVDAVQNVVGIKTVSEMSSKEMDTVLQRISEENFEHFKTVVANAKISVIAQKMEKTGKTLEELTVELDRGDFDGELKGITALVDTIDPSSRDNSAKMQSSGNLYKLERLEGMSQFLTTKAEIQKLQENTVVKPETVLTAVKELTDSGVTRVNDANQPKKISVKSMVKAIQEEKGKENIERN
jgi:hypothetical protein